MDPQEWQRLAEELAAEARAELDALEAEFWPEPSDPSFRTFWPRVRAVNERLQTAPAIDIEVKLTLLGRIRQMMKRAYDDQQGFYDEVKHRKAELLDRIAEVKAAGLVSDNIKTVQDARSDMQAMRDEAGRADMATRGDRQEVWKAWHNAGQELWDHLSAIWRGNEAKLSDILKDAQGDLDKGKVRETRDKIRQFNSEIKEHEASRNAQRTLRNRANKIWREAGEVAQVKHETFVAEAPQKVQRWKQVVGRNSRAIARLRSEIDDLERAGESSAVGAAFAKAMVDDKLRELRKLESTNDDLDRRIERTAAVVEPPVSSGKAGEAVEVNGDTLSISEEAAVGEHSPPAAEAGADSPAEAGTQSSIGAGTESPVEAKTENPVEAKTEKPVEDGTFEVSAVAPAEIELAHSDSPGVSPQESIAQLPDDLAEGEFPQDRASAGNHGNGAVGTAETMEHGMNGLTAPDSVPSSEASMPLDDTAQLDETVEAQVEISESADLDDEAADAESVPENRVNGSNEINGSADSPTEEATLPEQDPEAALSPAG